MRDMSAPALPTPRESPLSFIDAATWVEGLNTRTQARFAGFDWCTIGTSHVAHRLELVAHPDGSITYEPACRTGYWGSCQERIRPISRPTRMCGKTKCQLDDHGRRTMMMGVHPAQMELDLIL